MLPAKHRLRSEKDIKTLFAKGKSVFGMFLGIKYRKNSLGVSRFAVVVGTKVSKIAVRRNLIKRRIRAALQMHLSEIKPGYDVLILTKKEICSKSYAEIDAGLFWALKKALLV